jgi:hypothetical protein
MSVVSAPNEGGDAEPSVRELGGVHAARLDVARAPLSRPSTDTSRRGADDSGWRGAGLTGSCGNSHPFEQ